MQKKKNVGYTRMSRRMGRRWLLRDLARFRLLSLLNIRLRRVLPNDSGDELSRSHPLTQEHQIL
jgi:hypothetical protein